MYRRIDSLRISITDRCNLRCMYCMPPEGIAHIPPRELLTFEEIIRLVKIFVSLGTKKVRLTGGEALLRRNVINLIGSLNRIEGLEEIALTTNGMLLCRYAEDLKKSGINRMNLSLDTLKEERFKRITGGDSIDRVLHGIDKARELGFSPLKLNTVVMKGVNDDEIIDFIDFAFSKNLILRFIEFMDVTPLWKMDYFIPIEEVIEICRNRFSLEKIGCPGPGPAVYYKADNNGLLGFIKTDENNCRVCTRLRLSSTGELRNCLYETEGLSLRGLLRSNLSDEDMKDFILARMHGKQYVDYRTYNQPSRFYMCSIGG